MLRPLTLLWLLLLCAAALPAAVQTAAAQQPPAVEATEPGSRAPTLSGGDTLVPLPARCVGALPDGSGVPACCVSGYVLVNGKPVVGAKVTITSAHGTSEVWTTHTPHHPSPYYRSTLSDELLKVQVGETITLTAEYGDHTQTLTHTVLAGGQQVDLVLAPTGAEDYLVHEPTRWQSTPGKFNDPTAIAVDNADTVYVLDVGDARVQVFNSTGVYLRGWGSYGKAPGQFIDPRGIAVDNNGNIYIADRGNGRVQKLSSTGIPLAVWDSVGVEPWELSEPTGLAVHPDGRVFVVDMGHQRIHSFDEDGRWLAEWDTAIMRSLVYRPESIAIDEQGRVYLAGRDLDETGRGIFQRFTDQGIWLQTLADFSVGTWAYLTIALARDGTIYYGTPSPIIRVFTPDGTLSHTIGEYSRVESAVSLVTGLAVSPSGQLYVADAWKALIYKFDQQNELLRWGNDIPFELAEPRSVAIGRDDTVYLIDRTVLKLTTEGKYLERRPGNVATMKLAVNSTGTLYFTSCNQAQPSIGKMTRSGPYQLLTSVSPVGTPWFPCGIAVDSKDNYYVLDSLNNYVYKYNQDDQLIKKWGGTGTQNGQLRHPLSIVINGQDQLFIADTNNHRVQVFTAGGEWLRTWGTSGNEQQRLDSPYTLTVDKEGLIYVVDSFDTEAQIQKFTPYGRWLGSIKVYTTGAQAIVMSMAVDSHNNLYAVDLNARVEKFNAAGELLQIWGKRSADTTWNSFGTGAGADGFFYVTDPQSHQVSKLDPAGIVVKSWGGMGSEPGEFVFPDGIDVGPDGNVYVVDTGNRRIQKFDPEGTWLASFDDLDIEFDPEHHEFILPTPIDLTVDASLNMYVFSSDELMSSFIVKLDVNGNQTAWTTLSADFSEHSWNISIDSDSQSNIYLTNYHMGLYKINGDLTQEQHIACLCNAPTYYGLMVDDEDNIYMAALGSLYKLAPDGTILQERDIPAIATPSEFTSMGETIRQGADGQLYLINRDRHLLRRIAELSYVQPVATIVAAGPRVVVQGQPVTLIGRGADSDQSNASISYAWALNDQDAPFATSSSATLDTSALAVGRHTISLTITDEEGQTSTPETVSLEVLPPAQQPVETWTFLLYLDADTQPGSLAPYLSRDSQAGALFRLDHVASNPFVPVVALYDGPEHGDTVRSIRWPDGRRTEEPLGELDMANPQTLVDFVRWGQDQAPADHYYLSLVDHANALDGIAWDSTTGPEERLTNGELRAALAQVTDHGELPIDVLQLDVCLMGTLETAYQLQDLARYLIVSENLAWSAFAYEAYRAAVQERTSPAALATAIVERYAQRVEESGTVDGSLPYTIAALDLAQVRALAASVDALAQAGTSYALRGWTQRADLRTARARTQTLDGDANIVLNIYDEFVDLGDWVAQLQQVASPEIRQAAAEVATRLDAAVLAERHQSGSYFGYAVNLDRTHGLALYYPAQPSARTYQTYLEGGLRFPYETRWDTFLASALPNEDYRPQGQGQRAGPMIPISVQARIFLPQL